MAFIEIQWKLLTETVKQMHKKTRIVQVVAEGFTDSVIRTANYVGYRGGGDFTRFPSTENLKKDYGRQPLIHFEK